MVEWTSLLKPDTDPPEGDMGVGHLMMSQKTMLEDQWPSASQVFLVSPVKINKFR
jgi:hypothetical protein